MPGIVNAIKYAIARYIGAFVSFDLNIMLFPFHLLRCKYNINIHFYKKLIQLLEILLISLLTYTLNHFKASVET
jgi:hypothetical protein